MCDLGKNLRDFMDDKKVYVVVKYSKSDSMCTVEDFGFTRVIPVMPIFSHMMQQCSYCMDEDSFLVITLFDQSYQ